MESIGPGAPIAKPAVVKVDTILTTKAKANNQELSPGRSSSRYKYMVITTIINKLHKHAIVSGALSVSNGYCASVGAGVLSVDFFGPCLNACI